MEVYIGEIYIQNIRISPYNITFYESNILESLKQLVNKVNINNKFLCGIH